MPAAALALLLVIRMYDTVDLSPRDWERAQTVAMAILTEAGIDVRWKLCSTSFVPGPCTEPAGTDEVIVRVVSSRQIRRSSQSADTLGFAYVDTGARTGTLATVYADRIDVLSRASRIDRATLLGRTMAHEIGHLLLGTNEHPAEGLMRATWSVATLRKQSHEDWIFSAKEEAALRAKLIERSNWDPPYQPTSLPLSCSSSQVLSGAK